MSPSRAGAGDRGLAHARVPGARGIETCVPAASGGGLRFAVARGFVEAGRYVRDGGSDLRADLRLAAA
ncbi:hypothetical protein ACH4F6_12670 [Streptomyces sp. NPDC017936]|uniref:hypothetical protein n=1 Tax=Streptomyces sp. NPDC017936 TaxID=3365016 RepID=UPI0037ADB3EA